MNLKSSLALSCCCILVLMNCGSAGAATLEEALDATNLLWTTSGDSPWFFQTNVVHSGLSAAESGPLCCNGASSILQTVVRGPGTLTFWWRVNSETNAGFLSLFVDDNPQPAYRISGLVGWEQKSLAIPDGEHDLKWAFVRGFFFASSVSWLDGVRYVPDDMPPTFDSNPSSASVCTGAVVTFTALASGGRPLSYQWIFNGTNLNVTTPNLTLTDVGAQNVGAYHVVASNPVGSVTSTPALLSFRPNILTVTNTFDSGPGSLRQAIADACPNNTIVFDVGVTGTVGLTSGELVISTNLNIIGAGPSALTVSGNGASRVFRIGGGVVHISGLTIANGFVDADGGGGVLNGAELNLDDVVFTQNSGGNGSGKGGGGIYNLGLLSLRNCVLSQNDSPNAPGGGLQNVGTAAVFRCVFANNSCTEFDGGGGIRNFGRLASLLVDGCAITDNSAGWGGGIENDGQAEIVRSTLTRNRAVRNGIGGGALGNSGVLEVRGCTLGGNTTDADGGGVDNAGVLTIESSTISGNQALAGGGGIFGHDPSLTYILSSTIVSNSARFGGGFHGISVIASTISNSVIARNSASNPDYGNDCLLSVASVGDFNLIFDTNRCRLPTEANHNLYGLDPLLGPLQDNDGPTWTHALLPGSPALDAGHSGGLSTDQRGGARAVRSTTHPLPPGGDGSDIGAFEAGGYVRLASLTRTNGVAHLQFTKDATTAPLPLHTVQRRAALGPGAWEDLPGPVGSTNALVPFTDTTATNGQNFYRVRVGP